MTTLAQVVPPVNGRISVKAFGANGDGSNNDASAISDAITEAIAAGLDVYLPKGTYLISSEITITATAGVSIQGEAGQTSVRFASTARNGFTLAATTRNVTISNVTFTGDNNDDYSANYFPAIQMNDNVAGLSVENCRFEQCLPVQANDSYTSGRLSFRHNYVHNAPNGLHPPSDSNISLNHFVCDAIVGTRAQAIYAYGQQSNILIQGNTFKNINSQDIQIRSSNARYEQRSNFRIVDNHFENSKQNAVWIGSDDHPQITSFVVANNTFRNCNGPIACYTSSAEIGNNHAEWDWEYPHTLPSNADAIVLTTGIGSAGHYQVAQGAHIHDNTFVIKHPYISRIAIGSLPANNDTLTVGAFVYVWKTTASAELDIQIGADTRACAENLVSTLRGLDGRMTAPNNVIRFNTDVFNNYYGATYGSGSDSLVVVASWYDFTGTFSRTGTALTLTQPIDMRPAVAYPINVTGTSAPIVESNTFINVSKGPLLQQNYEPIYRNNTVIDNTGIAPPYAALANVFSHYHGNRVVQHNKPAQGRQYYAQISDGFPIVEDEFVTPQQYTNEELQGRSGLSLVGDGKAYTLLFYGMEMSSTTASRLFRWDDGDAVLLWNGAALTTYTFKRSSPGALQFNTADSLLTLINASGQWTASYVAFQNNLGGSDPKLMIKIVHTAGGTSGNAHRLFVRRYKKPSDTATFATVHQPLTCGQFLRDSMGTQNAGQSEEWCWFYGGAATLVKTFVYSPLANPKRGVWVQGHDNTSNALTPVVYAADIVPGVGFWITASAASGTEKFFWRVG